VDGEVLPLIPGEAVELEVGDTYYWASLSEVSWPLSGDEALYAQVDSYGDPGYGAVVETHEVLGWLYNNIEGPVYAGRGVSTAGPPAGPGLEKAYPEKLPRRP
jgi:hypothetical protein